MKPKVWGRSGWTLLFAITGDYPKKPDSMTANQYKQFFECLQFILPCPACCDNYASHYRRLSINPYLNNRDSLFEWLLKIHNFVRKYLYQPEISPDRLLSKYYNNRLALVEGRKDPLVWGFEAWKFLFAVAYQYPKRPTPKDQSHYRQFFMGLQHVLPCEPYRRRYARYLAEIPLDPYLASRYYLFEWVFKAHNTINKGLGRTLSSHHDALQTYFDGLFTTRHIQKSQS